MRSKESGSSTPSTCCSNQASTPARSIPSGTAAIPSGVPVASSPIGSQAYSRRRLRLSPSLANRLTIGFAIAFAVLTGLAVIGVARFLQQRQDFEDATARSYQREIEARTRLTQGRRPVAARAAIVSQQRQRQVLRDEISSETRDTALLVGAGLIAGLTGAALLFTGLISSMRRPLEDLVEASGRLAGGDLDARVQIGGLWRRRRRSAAPSTRWPRSCSAAPANATSSTG